MSLFHSCVRLFWWLFGVCGDNQFAMLTVSLVWWLLLYISDCCFLWNTVLKVAIYIFYSYMYCFVDCWLVLNVSCYVTLVAMKKLIVTVRLVLWLLLVMMTVSYNTGWLNLLHWLLVVSMVFVFVAMGTVILSCWLMVGHTNFQSVYIKYQW